MKDENRDLFPVLEPPLGGLAALRRRLDQEPRRQGNTWRWVLLPITVGVLTSLALLVSRGGSLPGRERLAIFRSPIMGSEIHPALVGLGTQATASSASVIALLVNERPVKPDPVPLDRADVAFFR